MTNGWSAGSSWEAVAPVCTMAYPLETFQEFLAASFVNEKVDWPRTVRNIMSQYRLLDQDLW